jgi:hypothetical protein
VRLVADGSSSDEVSSGTLYLTLDDIISALGGLPPASNHAAVLAVDDVKRLLKRVGTYAEIVAILSTRTTRSETLLPGSFVTLESTDEALVACASSAMHRSP